MNLPAIIKSSVGSVAGFCAKNSKTILRVVALTGAGGSVYLAIRATPRAMEVMDELHEEYGEKIPAKVLVQRIGPIYAPTAAMLLTTCGCIIGANRLADKENAILASIAAGAQGSLAEYERKLPALIGDEAAKKLKSEVAEKHVAEIPESVPKAPQLGTGEGFQLYRESLSGQFFWSTEHALCEAVTELNKKIDNEMSATLNDWLYLLDCDRCDIGDLHQWDVDRKLQIYTSPEKCRREPYAGRSYLMIYYEHRPLYYR